MIGKKISSKFCDNFNPNENSNVISYNNQWMCQLISICPVKGRRKKENTAKE